MQDDGIGRRAFVNLRAHGCYSHLNLILTGCTGDAGGSFHCRRERSDGARGEIAVGPGGAARLEIWVASGVLSVFEGTLVRVWGRAGSRSRHRVLSRVGFMRFEAVAGPMRALLVLLAAFLLSPVAPLASSVGEDAIATGVGTYVRTRASGEVCETPAHVWVSRGEITGRLRLNYWAPACLEGYNVIYSQINDFVCTGEADTVISCERHGEFDDGNTWDEAFTLEVDGGFTYLRTNTYGNRFDVFGQLARV